MSPPLLWIVWAVVGVVVGAYGTLIGAGGGFVLVPILLIVYLMIMAGGPPLPMCCMATSEGWCRSPLPSRWASSSEPRWARGPRAALVAG